MLAITMMRISFPLTKPAYLYRYLSTAPNPPEIFSEQDHSDARQWLCKLDKNTIPRGLGHVSFSRSSGPGGQNVNKYSTASGPSSRFGLMLDRVNSKATVRFHMKDLLSIVPTVLHPQLHASTYYAEKSHSLVIQADGSRRQSENVQDCFDKLKLMIKAAGKRVVRGETSPEKAAKIRKMYAILRCVQVSGITNLNTLKGKTWH